MMNLSLDKIKIDGGTQSRAKIDQDVVADYCEKMREGAQFPPIVVFYDGAEYFLADGFHRYFAAKKAGSPGFKCDVREGTLRDAILYSFGANISHGLRPSIADKRKSVTAMLLDIEWQEWSDREIARRCGVSHTFVAAIRKELGAEKTETKFKRDGKVTSRKEKPKQEDPVATFSEDEVEREEMTAAVQQLREENEDLQDQLTVALAASLDEIEKEKAQSVIKDLRAQIRLLEIELKAVTSSRDQFQAENAQLMKQVQMLQKKLKKLEGN
jgi:ParB-like chromosome segregation protein Spo0J